MSEKEIEEQDKIMISKYEKGDSSLRTMMFDEQIYRKVLRERLDMKPSDIWESLWRHETFTLNNILLGDPLWDKSNG